MGKIYADDEMLKSLSFKFPEEVVTAEQKDYENSGWYFVANANPESKDSSDGLPYIEFVTKGFMAYAFGTAYDMKGNLLPGYKALFVKPWARPVP